MFAEENLAHEGPSKKGYRTRACGGVPCRTREKCEEDRAAKMNCYGLTTIPGLLGVKRQRILE